MCIFFDPNDLGNQVNPCSETPSGGENGDGNGGNNCSSDLGANNGGNTCSIYSCPSHTGGIDPQPNWGAGGFSLDRP